MPPLLSEFPWRISYGASDDRLHDFYIPALESSVRFDRTTGFFSSAALAIAAAGVVRLIANGGRMRLLCGAQLSPEDVQAVQRGADLQGIVGERMAGCLADPADRSMKARLEALAWLVANGRLDMRVVLPRGKDGQPLAASEAREYYHPKEGLFEDREGNKLAFSGSSNDSENGWQWNYEVFNVYATFPLGKGPDEVPPLRGYVAGVEHRFGRLWEGQEESWIALDIPEAARRKLLSYCPTRAPVVDPLEKPQERGAVEVVPPQVPTGAPLEERILFRFLREAPYLPNAHRIGVETSSVTPWPHQLRVVQEVVRRYPQSFLFCDEVGLGKTIEAGLILRQLVLTGQVRRVLILAPKSVLRQWQEELYEKAVLNVPRFDDGGLVDVFGRARPMDVQQVWNACPLLLASSQLAKRRDRQGELLAADPWDLIIVDEAHHARRREFGTDKFRPNCLLELLAGTVAKPGLKARTSCLYLLTATPMQVHPVEVWDLLKVLGLGGRWGALKDNFLRFFEQLRQPFQDRDWDFLLAMVADALEAAGGAYDPAFEEKARERLGFVDWETVKKLPFTPRRKAIVSQLDPKAKVVLDLFVRTHTPLRSFLWRSTRALLRKYREAGLLQDRVPRRSPKPVWIELRPGEGNERELYDRVEVYISSFYQKYEEERKGLGFVMTVYRRRLTSSFYALEKSLDRRRRYLRGMAIPAGGLTDDDLEQDDLELDIADELGEEELARFKGELEYVEEFLRSIRALKGDSKLEQLLLDLGSLLKLRETVLIFTQYTDTMDYLRDQLRHVYAHQVACYSGRGGERWDGTAWVPRSKEEIKNEFRKGEEIKILLATESASEGLNLQTCGVLINYDMPWNPMRVEQRIGRIDRIGQVHEEVWILNYFYAETVEAIVYERLGDRIRWFEDVVGPLQPILHRVSRTIEQAAMLPSKERARRLDEQIEELRNQIDQARVDGLDLDAYVGARVELDRSAPSPVTLKDLETALLGSRTLGGLFKPHPDLASVHILAWGGQQRLVTFDAQVFDKHPETVELLSYGNPILEELLASVGDPPDSDGPSGIAFLHRDGSPSVSLFLRRGEQGPRGVQTTGELREALRETGESWSEADQGAARDRFEEAWSEAAGRLRRELETRMTAERLALVEEARQILLRTAYIELAEAQNIDLFSQPYPYSFGSEVVPALRRHGLPCRGLLTIIGSEELVATPTDPSFLALQGLPSDALRRRKEALHQNGIDLLGKYAALQGQLRQLREAPPAPTTEPRVIWYAPSSQASDSPASAPPPPPPFRVLPPDEVRPFENCIPLYDLKVAAGRFSEDQSVEEVVQAEEIQNPTAFTWVEPLGMVRPRRGLFVAQVVGDSMNRRIPAGAYCVFRLRPEGPRQGKLVLIQNASIKDQELGAGYTLKVYTSEKSRSAEGGWRHVRVVLKPDSTNRYHEPIVLEGIEEDTIRTIAEVLDVLHA